MKTNCQNNKNVIPFKAVVLFILLLVSTTLIKSQSVIIGTNTTNTNGSNPDPLDRFWNYTHFQIVYLASELSAGGMATGAQITALGFSVSESASLLTNFTISMGHTTQALAFPYISSGLIIVKPAFTYSPIPQPGGSFDMITFTTPFTWDGISNIVVNTCTGSNVAATPYGGLRYSSATLGRTRFIQTNNNSNCATATGTNTVNRPNIKFNYTNQSCSGIPTPGNTLSTFNPVCANTTPTLSLQNTTSGSGVTYQWQQSLNGTSWMDINGATSTTYNAITIPAEYKCIVSCGANSSSSNPISLTLNSFLNCYCVSQSATTTDEEIYNVTVNGASTNSLYSNANACTTIAPGPGSILSRYSNFKTLGNLTHFAPGASIPFSIVENECDGTPYFSFGTSIWIDYNQNGSFADPGEQVFVEGSALPGPRTITGVFTVPAAVMPGCTAMRITVADGLSGNGLTPCLSYASGETEDYMVCIDTACSGTPNIGIITAHYNSPCDSNTSIALTVNSGTVVAGITYQWEHSPAPTGPWVTISGSTSQSYIVPSTGMSTYYNCLQTCSSTGLSSPSSPFYLQPYPPLTIELDTVFCNGINSQGQHLYQYVLHVNNATSTNALIASITSPDGTIVSVSPTTILPGINVVSGHFITGSSVLTKFGFLRLNINIVYPPSTDTCYKLIYVNIPNCSGNVCDSNLVQNGTFVSGNLPGPLSGLGGVDHWARANGNPFVLNGTGCDESGYIKMHGNKISGDAIKQGLLPGSKIEKGKWYGVRMCVRLDSVLSVVPNLKMRVIAYNSLLPTGIHPPPSSNVSIIGFTGLINSTVWTTIELDPWYAYKDFDSIAMNIFNNDSTYNSVGYIDGVCVHEVTDTCNCDGFDRDSLGNVIIPPELLALMDTTDQTIDTVDMFMGKLTDIYGDWNTDLDTFYNGTPDLCCKSIGGKIPDAVDDFSPEDSLAALGVPISMDSVRRILSDVSNDLADSLLANFPNFEDNFGELSLIPGIQIDSLCFCDSTTSSIPLDPASPFQGMDIIFVHGLDVDAIKQKIFDYSSFQHLTKWPEDKKEFYNNYHSNGYYGGWKKYADDYWRAHVIEYLRPPGSTYNNRYLTIAWPSTQRMPYDVHAMLSQIYEAMSNGQGVELINASDPRGKKDFGKNGLVIISHSTGGLITNVAMAVAEQTKTILPLRAIYGPAYRISDKAKVHIAMHTALAGSHIATVGLALLDRPALLGLANVVFEGGLPSIPSVIDYAFTAKKSVLVDLCPPVSQLVWMYPISTLNLNPVRTLTIAGGDPGNSSVGNSLLLKALLLPGFDDGVLTLECQTGNPLPASLPNIPIPSVYSLAYGLISAPGVYFPTSKLKAVDMGIKPHRAASYYIAQFKEEHSLSGAASAGCTPFISPTGMVQPFNYNSFTRNSLLRYTKHYSFLQSTSYHNSGPKGTLAFGNAPYYSNLYTPSFGENNNEEESVITNNAVYTDGLVSPSFKGLMERTLKGPHKTFKFKVPFCKKCKTYSKTIWLWQRNYDRLHDFENKLECDYIYQYVLKP